ncbi:HNH endonuclease [Bacillus phage Moonbeam]|uniref:HNH homing endonuclease n=1 Tax=Bacillus phage Moonbeam TaxID=1540091 RepID=A0A0A0RNA9_9CAUD|nr:HNH endonuclease [Bacillus phage Moonbeam]AIW03580.1 HNH homing endonuclease [Bacillus phage Moonbeam]
MEEMWKPLKDIVENGDNYEISNLGKVRNIKTGRLLSLKSGRTGYVSVMLSLKAKNKTYRVHRLVTLAFLPNPTSKTQVNHKDGVKDNNVLSNLEWATPLENIQHASETGLRDGTKGSGNYQAKLTEDQVVDIKQRLMAGETIVSLAERYKVSVATISYIHQGRVWSQVKVKGFTEIKGRAVGERASTAVLTAKQVKEIRRVYSIGILDCRQLSEMFNVSFQTIWNVVNYKTWKHVE